MAYKKKKNDTIDELTSFTYSLKADKVDSALLLLDTYRDKIKYDTKKKAWTIHRAYIDTVKTIKSTNQTNE